MTTLFMVRHGETYWNREGLIQGHLDSALTGTGRRTVLEVASRLRQHRLECIYSSDLGRARTSAEIIAGELGLYLHLSPHLREQNFGIFNGGTVEALLAQHPNFLDDPEAVPEGGESFAQMQKRVAHFIRSLSTEKPDSRLVIVCHCGVIRALYRAFFENRPALSRMRSSHSYIGKYQLEGGRVMGYEEIQN